MENRLSWIYTEKFNPQAIIELEKIKDDIKPRKIAELEYKILE